MCVASIRRHISSIPPTEIFTTRHLLIYGLRKTVDSALWRMVSTKEIYRLARGVFVKNLSGNPTLQQIVEAKLKAFCGKIAIHATKILSKFYVTSDEIEHTFAKNGSSSSFETIRGRAILKNQCARKMRLYQEEVGRAAMALWHLGDDFIDSAVDTLTASFNRTDRLRFLLAASLKPAWLVNASAHRYPNTVICLRNPFFESS
jgi:hypothetical protein